MNAPRFSEASYPCASGTDDYFVHINIGRLLDCECDGARDRIRTSRTSNHFPDRPNADSHDLARRFVMRSTLAQIDRQIRLSRGLLPLSGRRLLV